MPRSKIAAAAGVAAAITFGGIAGAVVVSPDSGGGDGAVAHHRGAGFGQRVITGLESLAEVLGLSTQELRDALADGRSIGEVAEANGVERQAVIDTLVADANERIDAAVADGRLTTEQADARKADVVERVTAFVDGDARPFPRPGRHHRREWLDVAADAIGIDERALLEGLRDGESVAEVAEANDVDPQDVIDALVADVTERITEFVNR